MKRLTRNFVSAEFACKCGCGFNDVDQELVERLQKLRDQIAFNYLPAPVKVEVTSGCRCESWNAAVGGSDRSFHKKGLAADIQCFVLSSLGEWEQISPKEVALLCEELFPDGGLGEYNSFTHVDTRGYKARW